MGCGGDISYFLKAMVSITGAHMALELGPSFVYSQANHIVGFANTVFNSFFLNSKM